MSRRRPQFTMRAAVRDLLAAAGDAGLTLAELEAATNAPRGQVQSCLGKLGEEGEKFSAPVTSKVWRHFATEAQRDAWLTGQPAAVTAPRYVPMPKPHQALTVAPKIEHGRLRGEMSVPASARITSVAAPRGRFDPEPGFRGAFSLAGIGRDVQTGRGWA